MIEAPAVTEWKAEGMTQRVIRLLKTQFTNVPEESRGQDSGLPG